MRTSTVARRLAVVLVAGLCFGTIQGDAQTLPALANVSANADKQAALVNASTGATAVIAGSSPLTGAGMAISDTAYDAALHRMFVVDASNNKLLTISMATGAVVNNPTLTLPANTLNVTDLEWDGSSTLFGIVTKTGGDKQLATFNITSGAATLVGASGIEGANVGTFSQPFDLDPVGHRYYMVGSPAAGDKLYSINTSTGAVADSVLLAGKLPVGTTTIFGLEYDTGESKLYGLIGLASGDKQLISINTTSGGTFGNITLIGASGVGGGTPVSLSGAEALNPSGNTYYAKASINGNAVLLAIDTVTGAAAQRTLTFGATINDVRALEFDPPSTRHKDFNADGYSDLVWRNSSTGASAVWLMNGASPSAGSGATNLQFQNNSFSCAGVGDFDGNGKADIVWRNTTTGQTIMWLMNGVNAVSGSGEFANVPPPWQIVGVGDFNGDSKSDLLWRNTSTGQNSIWLLNTLTVLAGSGETNQIADVNWHVGGVGDFNGDGKSDILWRNDITGQSSMWMMNGTTVLSDSGATNLQIGTAYRAAAVGDFNGDGYSDVMWRNINTGDNIIWLQHGTVTQAGSGAVSPVADSNWNVAAVGDYNADGKDDIVWRNDVTGDTSIWMLNGAAFGAGSGILGTTPPPWTIPQPR
jgi:hypothetical protein